MTYSLRPRASEWRSLPRLLADTHERGRKAVLDAIAQRTRDGVPLDDLGPSWVDRAQRLAAEAWSCADRSDAAKKLQAAALVAGGGLRDPGAHIPFAAAEGVEVRLRLMLRTDVADVRGRYFDVDGDGRAQQVERMKIERELVGVGLAGIRGHRDGIGACSSWEGLDSPVPAEVLDDIDGAGLVAALFGACLAFQDIDPFERASFGLSRP